MYLPRLRRSARQRPTPQHMPVRRKAWVFAGLMAGALIPLLVVQSQASAYDVFCVGGSWKSPSGNETMEEVEYPSPLPSDIRSLWPKGLPGGDSVAMNVVDSPDVTYVFYPDYAQKYMCAETSAAPCVISETVSLTYETWQSQHWSAGTDSGATFPYLTVKASFEYGMEWGSRQSKTTSISNMAPYKLGDIIQPAHFIEWRGRSAEVRGGYFNTNATCRTSDGEFGEQYRWKDDATGIPVSFERNIGEGSVWLKEGEPTNWVRPYKGQDGGLPPNYPADWSE
jgi:hypothetical protein